MITEHFWPNIKERKKRTQKPWMGHPFPHLLMQEVNKQAERGQHDLGALLWYLHQELGEVTQARSILHELSGVHLRDLPHHLCHNRGDAKGLNQKDHALCTRDDHVLKVLQELWRDREAKQVISDKQADTLKKLLLLAYMEKERVNKYEGKTPWLWNKLCKKQIYRFKFL